jgi:outer membrane lipase/esterase
MHTRNWLYSALAVSALAAALPARASSIDNIVFFGDSLSDTGNVWYATGGFPPAPYYQGSSGAPPARTGGQWSDYLGPSWPTVFAAKFGLYATPSVVGGNNYAWGGARTRSNPDPTGVPWLNQQLGLYLSGNAPNDSTLYSIVIGGNDVANNLGSVPALEAGIASIVGSMTTLYGAGARQFLVANVPDIGATPRFQEIDAGAPGTAAFATFWTTQWNAALAAALGSLSLPGASVGVLDFFGLAKDPAVLAMFENTTDACLTSTSLCADPSKYFYWDTFHPSSRSHAVVADFAARAVGVPEPGSLALMLLGLGGLAAAARRRARR